MRGHGRADPRVPRRCCSPRRKRRTSPRELSLSVGQQRGAGEHGPSGSTRRSTGRARAPHCPMRPSSLVANLHGWGDTARAVRVADAPPAGSSSAHCDPAGAGDRETLTLGYGGCLELLRRRTSGPRYGLDVSDILANSGGRAFVVGGRRNEVDRRIDWQGRRLTDGRARSATRRGFPDGHRATNHQGGSAQSSSLRVQRAGVSRRGRGAGTGRSA